MRTIIAMAALVLATSVANAAPINFVCDGKTTEAKDNRDFQEMLALTIDLDAKTVALENYSSAPITEIHEDKIVFDIGPQRFPYLRLSYGFINRISGAIDAYIMSASSGTLVFVGLCRRTEKLF